MSIFLDRNVSPEEIRMAEYVCETANSELSFFEINMAGIDVKCKNSASFLMASDNFDIFEKKYKEFGLDNE